MFLVDNGGLLREALVLTLDFVTGWTNQYLHLMRRGIKNVPPPTPPYFFVSRRVVGRYWRL